MRALWACIKKDILLFLSRKSSVLLLVLPVLLAAVLLPGFGETASAGAFVKPFRIAIRDQDGSVMSRSLVSQLKDYDLFEEIMSVPSDDPDTQKYFDSGCAAVMTLPQNFFYAMYDMENIPATVELNPEMPAESAIFESILTSVTDIVVSEQRARRAEYETLKELGADPGLDEFFYESANYELRRALGRGSAFEETDVVRDLSESALHSVWTTVVIMLSMLIPLCVLKSLPEELSIGIVSRLRCSDSGERMLLLSKYIAALLIFLVPSAAVTLLTRPELSPVCLLGVFLGFSASFALFTILSFSSTSASKAQLIGNIILILSMMLGGTLYPYRLLPEAVQSISLLTIPYHTMSVMNGNGSSLLWLGVLLAVCSFFAVLSVRRQQMTGKRV